MDPCTRLLLLLALLLPACADAPAPADAPAAAPPLEAGLTGRVWMRTDSTGLPGVMRTFLADGTLIMDSCWETYRLAPWHLRAADSTVAWDEDGVEVAARILAVGPDRLHLRLDVGEGHEEHYAPATVPFVCPDMPR